MKCTGSCVTSCFVALAAVVSCLVWVSLQQEASTLSLIVRGMQIRSENADWMQQWATELRTTKVAHKTVLLTGGSRGLGRGIAAHLLGAGAYLVLPLREFPSDEPAFRRELAAEAKALGYGTISADKLSVPVGFENNMLLLPMDLSDFASIERFAFVLKELPVVVDVLINNAGLVSLSPNTTAQGFEMTMGVNFFGTAHLTMLLDENKVLAKDAVVVNVGSEEHRGAIPLPSDPLNPPEEPFGRGNFSLASKLAAYGQSKLALAAWSYELARRWKAPRVVRCVCPGPVVSEIGRAAPWPLPQIVGLGMKAFFQPATEAALPVLWLGLSPAAQKQIDLNWHMSRPKAAGQNASDPAVGKWIWDELLRARSTPSVRV